MPRRRLRDLSIVQNTTNLEEVGTEQQTVVGSSSVPKTLDDSVEFQTENGGTRRGRGRTLLTDLYNLNSVERVKDRERVGTSSRQNKKFTYTAGSRSFARVAQAAEASSGQKVGRLQFFDITHRKKDGTPMTSEAAEIMEKLKDKKAKYEATASTDSSVNFEDIDNIIINKVLGPERYGRVRFQGSSVNPTQYFGSTSHQYMPSGSQSQAEVQRLKDQIVQIQASTDEQISQLRAEVAAREEEVE
ncbi:hypothetical protein GOBAR_AA07451 [Gossypium barbadense]|uniref:Uncharacterized protein n=1 Tax=Gossypium barbadense TaxID=3634 RepID=A0A2P5YC72_GOSBA|nr:hypothetical protein GOBAR_AA07451 [Gossypium barbadense]